MVLLLELRPDDVEPLDLDPLVEPDELPALDSDPADASDALPVEADDEDPFDEATPRGEVPEDDRVLGVVGIVLLVGDEGVEAGISQWYWAGRESSIGRLPGV